MSKCRHAGCPQCTRTRQGSRLGTVGDAVGKLSWINECLGILLNLGSSFGLSCGVYLEFLVGELFI